MYYVKSRQLPRNKNANVKVKMVVNMEQTLKQTIKQIQEAMYRCADIMLQAENIQNKVTSKEGHANFVTEYDKRVQAALEKELLTILPDAVMIGEEDDIQKELPDGYAYIVDPIDGTSNFMLGCNCSCISVALIYNKERVAGAVYNPYQKEMFYAIKGQGAYLNEQPIHVSEFPINHSLVGFGTSPYYDGLMEKSFRLAMYYCEEAIDIRRSGSAAIDLCNVACGRTGMFFELRLQPWDFAAGSLIVEEAGGVVVDVDQNPIDVSRYSSVFAMSKAVAEDEKLKFSI